MRHYGSDYRRKNSTRLQGYDYRNEGLYFLTLDIQHWLCLFGSISQKQMFCNEAGQMVYKWYYEMENKYKHLICHEVMVMPNHFHCIIEINRCDWRRKEAAKNDSEITKNAGVFEIMDWFKTMTTCEYIRGVKQHNWQRFEGKLWQRGYYDSIIRTEQAYHNISNYIINNPKNWRNDKFFRDT